MFLESSKNKFGLLIIFIFLYVGCLFLYINNGLMQRGLLISLSAPSQRIFIFTTDNRPLRHHTSQFHVLAALINFQYARRHGYTYRYFQTMYNDSRRIAKNIPFRPGCFNQLLNQERSTHWAKLQIIWHVLQTYSQQYDLFLYIDSDAVVNLHSLEMHRFLSNLSFVPSSKCKTFDLDGCHIIFGSDPWKRTSSFTVPNSGLFIFRPTRQFHRLVQLWWHLNMHESNFYGFYEQDSLWNLLEDVPSPAARPPSAEEIAKRESWNSQVKEMFRREALSSRVGILEIETFGNKNASQFFVHMTSGLGVDHRQPELQNIWKDVCGSLNETAVFSDLIEQARIPMDTTNDLIPWHISSPISVDKTGIVRVNV